MHVVIVCDSKFGNTRHLADAMGEALRPAHQVEIREPSTGLTDRSGIDLLLVGGPTHAHGASAPMKETVGHLRPESMQGIRAATFDTRFHMARVLTGSAAGVLTKWLKGAGAVVVAPPESFFVTRGDPPALEVGELDRAVTWARELVTTN